jgi:hypothetical protein
MALAQKLTIPTPGLGKKRLTAVGSVALTTLHPLSANVGRSVGIVRLRTKATQFSSPSSV